METIIRRTRSVCPRCLRNLPAQLVRQEDGRILLEKRCPEHGLFRAPVWQGKVDWESWLLDAPPLAPQDGLRCPADCGICPEHEIGSCCVMLEVTKRCDLRNDCGDITVKNMKITEDSVISNDLGDITVEHAPDVRVTADTDMGKVNVAQTNEKASVMLTITNSSGNINVGK